MKEEEGGWEGRWGGEGRGGEKGGGFVVEGSHKLGFSPGFGNPTSVDFVWTNLHQMVASYQAAKIITFDLETGQCVTNLDSGSTYGKHCLLVERSCAITPTIFWERERHQMDIVEPPVEGICISPS